VIDLLEKNLKGIKYLENPKIKAKLSKQNINLKDYNAINDFMEQEEQKEEKIEYHYCRIPNPAGNPPGGCPLKQYTRPCRDNCPAEYEGSD